MMKYAEQVAEIHKDLHKRAKDKNDFVGWLTLPDTYDRKEFEKIKKCAQKIQEDSDVLVVIGIGGSYLGARAVIESLTHTFYNLLPKEQRRTPQILFVGNNLSESYITDMLELIGDRDLSVNVISNQEPQQNQLLLFVFLESF